MSTNPNQILFDASVRHQINLVSYAEGAYNATLRPLHTNEKALERLIQSRLGGKSPEAQLRRMPTLLKMLEASRLKAWKEAEGAFMERMTGLAKVEPQILISILNKVELTADVPSPEVIRDVLLRRQVEGRTLRQWLRALRDEDLRRLRAAVARGVVSQETPTAIARALLGTKATKGADGALAAGRKSLRTVARTGTTHVASEIYIETLAANPDLFDREIYTAILDSRTTPLCRSLDGDIYPVGQGPQPPQHFNCRSRRVPLLPGHSDPERETYAQWLRRQDVLTQEDALGKTKAKLFREGKIELKGFVAEDGRELTLQQLADRGN